MMHAIEAIEEVSPAWLEAALATRFPGVAVRGFRFGTVIRGMATKAQLLIDYAEPAGAPATMWLKGGFEAHSERSAPLYAAETRFYRDLAPRLPINAAHAYHTHIDGDGSHALLLLEDLTERRARFGRPGEHLSVEQAERVLDLLAQLHGLPQREPGLVAAHPWLGEPGAIDRVDVVGEYFGFWDVASQKPRFALLPEPLRDRPRMLAALRRMRALDETGERRSLIHGDVHPGNMFFEPDGRLGLLDWQTVMLGHWAADIAYFLILGLTVADRRHHERRLIRRYLDALAATGADAPDFETAWLDYRRRAAWSFLTALCPVDRQPEDTCCAWAERAGAAITDLATVEALAA